MRKARQDELPALAALMFDQFYEKEELRQQFSGVDMETARQVGPTILSLGQDYFFEHGDVFVCETADGALTGALVGTDPCRRAPLGPLAQIIYLLRRGRALRGIPKRLLAQLTRNSRPVMAVHSMNWYRRYCNRPYYIAQFAVAKAHRGTGVARELMDGALARAAALGCQTVALETFSRETVPIYLHFGFQLKQVHTCGAFTEYRLLKPLE